MRRPWRLLAQFARRGRRAHPLPPCPPRVLAEVVANMRALGVTVEIGGIEVEDYLDARGAEAAYWPDDHRPGTVFFRASPSRVAVAEESFHVEQYHERGWVPATPLENCELEIDAQYRLLAEAALNGWTTEEVALIERNLASWEAERDAELRRQA